jgi:uncharacterized protein
MRRRSPAGPPPDSDGRAALDLDRAETARLCRGCSACCTYITVEVDAPSAAWEYDQWLWALHHRGVELYVERPRRWSVHFATRCAELGRDGRCRIHGRHPVMCREHDPRSCERWLPLSDVRAWFRTPAELEAWIRARRPAHWRRLLAWRRARTLGGQRAPGRTAVIPARGSASTRRSG